VPDEIYAIADVPRTLNAKKLEVPVIKILSGIPVEKAVNVDKDEQSGVYRILCEACHSAAGQGWSIMVKSMLYARFKTDRRTIGILDFGWRTSTFTCATQLAPFQRVNIFDTDGRIEIEIPFNAPPDRPCKIAYQNGNESGDN